LNTKDDDKSLNLRGSIPEETLKELSVIADDCLTQAGLTVLSEKLSLSSTAK
jgi:hypothetical protein